MLRWPQFCMSHSRLDPIVELPEVTAEGTLIRELLEIARKRLGDQTVLEFDNELVTEMVCPNCGLVSPVFKRMASLYDSEFTCPDCGERREMKLTHRIDGSEEFLDRSLKAVDIPLLGIVQARNGSQREYLELTGDKNIFLDFN